MRQCDDLRTTYSNLCDCEHAQILLNVNNAIANVKSIIPSLDVEVARIRAKRKPLNILQTPMTDQMPHPLGISTIRYIQTACKRSIQSHWPDDAFKGCSFTGCRSYATGPMLFLARQVTEMSFPQIAVLLSEETEFLKSQACMGAMVAHASAPGHPVTAQHCSARALFRCGTITCFV